MPCKIDSNTDHNMKCMNSLLTGNINLARVQSIVNIKTIIYAYYNEYLIGLCVKITDSVSTAWTHVMFVTSRTMHSH